MRELAVQGANETNTGSDRAKISEELTQLHEEIDRIAESTQFNGKDLLNGKNEVRTETVYTTSKETGKTKDVKVEKGFDFEGLGKGDLKVDTNTNKGKVSFKDTNITGYGITVSDIDGATGQINKDAIITITDRNGKTMSFTAEANIAAADDVKIGTIDTTDKSINGKEISLQVGANTSDSQTLKVKIENVSTSSLGLDAKTIATMAKEGPKGTEAANAMIDSLDNALERVNTSRANLGAMQNRLETTASNLTTSNENLTAAESRIRDVDVAEEMMNLSKLNLINQAAQAMMSQAKSQPEGVMQLLR